MWSRKRKCFDVQIIYGCVLLQCVVGGCNASFASQGGLARHVPSHFSQQSSSKMSSQAKLKEDSPSKAGLNKRKKLKNKRRCSLRTYQCQHTNQALVKARKSWFPWQSHVQILLLVLSSLVKCIYSSFRLHEVFFRLCGYFGRCFKC